MLGFSVGLSVSHVMSVSLGQASLSTSEPVSQQSVRSGPVRWALQLAGWLAVDHCQDRPPGQPGSQRGSQGAR
jgi:hypothetical protein